MTDMFETWATNRDLSNLRFTESKMPDHLYNKLNAEIEILSQDSEKFNHKLQGHIKEEYSLNHIKEQFESWLLSLAQVWVDNNPGYLNEFEEASKYDSYELYLDNLWVNKQRKHEFNPIHYHSGVLSFVIWLKIPYDLDDEINYFPLISGTTNNNKNNFFTSKFCFVYNDVLGQIKQLPVPVDKSFEGTILMFPSSLNHTVYPFYTSEDYRVSVSGNIRIRSKD